MKLLRVENYKTGEFYFAAVENNDNRIDPLNMFSENFMDTTDPNHMTHNVNRVILKPNLSKEQVSVDMITLKKKYPQALNNRVVVEVNTKNNTSVVIKDKVKGKRLKKVVTNNVNIKFEQEKLEE